LRELFESTGRQVTSVRIVTDRETGRSRGFAFVEFASPSDAQAALDELNGRNVDGRPIRLDLAHDRDEKRGGDDRRGGGGRGGGGGGRERY